MLAKVSILLASLALCSPALARPSDSSSSLRPAATLATSRMPTSGTTSPHGAIVLFSCGLLLALRRRGA